MALDHWVAKAAQLRISRGHQQPITHHACAQPPATSAIHNLERLSGRSFTFLPNAHWYPDVRALSNPPFHLLNKLDSGKQYSHLVGG